MERMILDPDLQLPKPYNGVWSEGLGSEGLREGSSGERGSWRGEDE